MVKPKKKCVITHESTFSVTGFLTFAVVSATAVANVIANINNNNDNNNNNNNQDNVNNNNQVSNSADAENQGNARSMMFENQKNTRSMMSDIQGNVRSMMSENNNHLNFFCQIVEGEASKGNLENLMTSILGFTLADFLPNFKHEQVVDIMENQHNYCVK